MTLRSKYASLKNEYNDLVILLKSGMFFVTYNDDAMIMNNLFGYQIINNKLGFPNQNLQIITDKLENESIGYVIFMDDVTELTIIKPDTNRYYYFFEEVKKKQFSKELNEIIIQRV